MVQIQEGPLLRFPNFKSSWETRKLRDLIYSIESGVSVNSEDYPASIAGNYGVLKTSCILSGLFKPNENKQILAVDIHRAKLKPARNSIIVSRMNTPQLVGESGYVNDNFPYLYLPDRLWMIKTTEDVDAKWLSLVLISSKIRTTLTNIATGTSGSMKNIAQPNFLKIETLKPSLPEQQKIATFLTAVDDKIQQLGKKRTLLEQYKKGVMQQIFSLKIRFKDDDGNEFPDWEETELREICDYKNGGSFENYVVDEGLYNLITLNSIDIKGNLKTIHKRVSKTDNSLNKGDLVMVLSDVAHGYLLGLTDIIPSNNYVLNQRMGALKPKIEVISYYLKSFINFNQSYFRLMGQGSSQQNLSKNDIIQFRVGLPLVEEQIKIANFLSAIETKIDSVNQQIEQSKQFKKGLLQQMFV